MPPLDPFSDIDRSAPSRQRVAPRQRVLKVAKIAHLNAKTLIDCQVRDISETGARLRCAAVGAVPNDFYLILPAEKIRRRARVAWRRGEEIGVHFIGEKEPARRRKG